ncbi:unnamed protein product [Adineta steineri]|uniref:Uncharacterized protein n=1 Tax=Adineta steineri TaxID=433720 RepID=A0A819RLK7_9BILA|nr:unnamed protein product [Adineta steineri]
MAGWGATLETMLVGELAPHSFHYTDGRLGRDVSAVDSSLSTGTVTEGGKFHLFSVSNFLQGQALPRDVLAISVRRLESDADPHFIANTPIMNPTIFYDYSNSASPISQIIYKLQRAFELFDQNLFKLLHDAGFKR